MVLEVLQRKIKTTQDLRDIVSTMKTLSSVSILQYEKANLALARYRRNLRDAFHAVIKYQGLPLINPPLNQKKRYLFILIGTDNGMVGKFNKEILLAEQKYLREHHIAGEDVLLICIGKRTAMLAEQEKLPIYARYATSNSVKRVSSLAETIIMRIDEVTRAEKITNVGVWFHKKHRNGTVSLEHRQIIPFDTSRLRALRDKPWDTNNVPMLPLPQEQMFTALVRETLIITLSTQLNYSLAAEHYTRMTNMQNAEKNIDENLAALDLEYQRERQENITDELIDVISGAEAMK